MSFHKSSTPTRWHDQTKVGGGHAPPEERGDCVPVCMEGILGFAPGTLPNIHGAGWWERLQAALAVHGYACAMMDVRYDPPEDMLWIATVPSLNLPPDPDGKPAQHCIVVRGREFVHDPSLGEKYDAWKWVEAWNDDKVSEGWLLVQLDPCTKSAPISVKAA